MTMSEPNGKNNELMLDYPPELGPIARQEWDRIRPEINASELSKPIDRGVLTIYCAAYAIWAEAAEAIQKYGAVIKTASGYPVPSPFVAIFNQQTATMVRIACEYGFTPASRKRLPFRNKIIWNDLPKNPPRAKTRTKKLRPARPEVPVEGKSRG
jgi:P27 family predicted phage terminase small subunit